LSKVFIILGPTASGKTKLSIELAKVLNGEIISADSMQVYKFMVIGTAKPDMEEMEGVKHYLIDEILPNEEFSVAKFQELALKYIDDILLKGKTPIITGGTGLYINSLIYNINFSETISDWELRERLSKIAEEKGNKYLHDMLKEVDPETSEKIHENNVKRVVRALEVYEYTKRPISYHQELSLSVPSKHEFVIIGLRMDRERLYEKINNRVDIMFEKGLINEVKKLIELGYHNNAIAMQGIGYKEILSNIRGEISIEEAKEIIKRDSRHYAKRQITWFKRIQNIFCLDVY
jgi:tRNA dimethylallyltransferase